MLKKTEDKVEGKTLAPREVPAAFGWPFPTMRRFFEDWDRLFEDFGRPFGLPARWKAPFEAGTIGWVPDVEVMDRNGTFKVKVDLPGLTRDDVKVEVKENELIIEGERKKETEEKGEGFYRSERSYGTFYRCLPLPEGAEVDKAKATFLNGVLEVSVPTPVARKIEGRKLAIEEAKPEKPKAA